jgi:hypothetical protein
MAEPMCYRVRLLRRTGRTSLVVLSVLLLGSAMADAARARSAADEACHAKTLTGTLRGEVDWDQDRTQLTGWWNDQPIIQRYIEDVRLCMVQHGQVVAVQDGAGVQEIQPGGWVVLESEAGSVKRLVISPGSNGLEYRWSLDGRTRPFDAAARQWSEAMLKVLGAYWQSGVLRHDTAGSGAGPDSIERAHRLEASVASEVATLLGLAR